MTKRILFAQFLLIFSLAGYSQEVDYEVYALRFTDPSKPFPMSTQVLNGPDSVMGRGVFMFWLIKGEGKNILVDAGFLNDVEQAKSRVLTNYVRPDSMLLRIGINAAEITDIILTHPHWDHADGIDLFPNATVWMQKDDYGYYLGEAWQKDGNRGGINPRDVRKLLELNLKGLLVLVDGDNREILPGITVFTGSRHTFNSQYVRVHSGTDNIIMASDNAKYYYNLDHLMSVPESGTFDTTAYVKAMERMKTQASDTKFIIPGHDALLFSKFPEVAEGIIRIK